MERDEQPTETNGGDFVISRCHQLCGTGLGRVRWGEERALKRQAEPCS